MIAVFSYDGGNGGAGTITATIIGATPGWEFFFRTFDSGTSSSDAQTADGGGNATLTVTGIGGGSYVDGDWFGAFLTTDGGTPGGPGGTGDSIPVAASTFEIGVAAALNLNPGDVSATWDHTTGLVTVNYTPRGQDTDILEWWDNGFSDDPGGTLPSQTMTHDFGTAPDGDIGLLEVFNATTGNYNTIAVFWYFATGDTVFTPTPVLAAEFHATHLTALLGTATHFVDDSEEGPSGPITGWNWDFGDTTGSTAQNPNHTYGAAGRYTVTLTVTGTAPDGTDSLIKSNYIDVVDPTEMKLYAARDVGSTSDLYLVDPVTAALTSIGDIGDSMSGMAWDPTTGVLYGCTAGSTSANPQSLLTIDRSTGAGTLVGGFGRQMHDLAFDTDGNLWGVDTNGRVCQIDKATGTVTHVFSGGTYGGGIDFDSGGTLWRVGDRLLNDSTVDTSDGTQTIASTVSDSTQKKTGKFDPNDLFWLGSPGGVGGGATDLTTVDAPSGTVTEINPFSPVTIGALAWYNETPIPPNFSAALVPNSIIVSDGISTLVHLNTHAFNGDTETITLSASAPAGFTLIFPDNPITAGDIDVPIDIAVGSPGLGSFTITIHCVGTDNSHDVDLSVDVVALVPGTHIAS
jgi:PKD repeat protein